MRRAHSGLFSLVHAAAAIGAVAIGAALGDPRAVAGSHC